MAREPSRVLIGAFVVGAVALCAMALAALGSGRLFERRPRFVMYFSGSITGLSVGSPVLFRGVRVGEVTEIAAVFDPRGLDITIPVYVELDPKSFRVVDPQPGGTSDPFTTNRLYRPLLDKGLKAQLELLSFITAQLYVSLDFKPEVPVKLVGLDPSVPEIPTAPSLREQIMLAVQNLPAKISTVADAVERWVNAPETQENLRRMSGTLAEVTALVREVRAEVKPLAASLTQTSEAARRTFAQATRTLKLEDGPSAELATSVKDAARSATASMDALRATLGSVQRVADRSADVGYDLASTLSELDATARAVRALVEELEQRPESLVKGRR